MRTIIVAVLLVTLSLIALFYKKNKNLKTLLIAVGTLGAIVSLAVMGNVTRHILPLYLAHSVLLIFSWGALIAYILRGKYYWWIIASPVVTLVLFFVLEWLTGASHE